MAQRKSTAIIREQTVNEAARHTVRWTSLAVLSGSFVGTIMAFNGGWPTSWQLWTQVSFLAIIAGILVQAFCTLMQWANRNERHSPKYLAPVAIDIAATYVGYAMLLIPIFQTALRNAMLPEDVASILAHAGVVIVAIWAAVYPEQNLVEE